MNKKSLIIALCNYGQVRSVALVKELRTQGYKKSHYLGLLNFGVNDIDYTLSKADIIIVCNQKDIDNKLKGNDIPNLKERRELITKKYKNKVIICEEIGFDNYQSSQHPKLVKICQDFVSKNNKED